MTMYSLLQVAAEATSNSRGLGFIGAGLGAGLAVIGAGLGIGRIGTAALILAALIEGVALFAAVIAFQIAGKL